jgi:hypothetical protein
MAHHFEQTFVERSNLNLRHLTSARDLEIRLPWKSENGALNKISGY